MGSAPFVAGDDTLFVGSKDSHIFTLELDTGNLQSAHSGRGLSTPLVPTVEEVDKLVRLTLFPLITCRFAPFTHLHGRLICLVVLAFDSFMSCEQTTQCGPSTTRLVRSDGTLP